MFKHKLRSFSVAVGLITILSMMLGTSRVAFAAAPTGSSQNTNGTLAISGSSSLGLATPSNLAFNSVSLNGSAQDVTNTEGSFNIDVTDASGLADGWNVTLVATTFTGTTQADHVLPDNTLSVSGLIANKLDSTSSMPVSSVNPSTTPVAITTAASNPTPSEIYNAAPGTGMGNFELDTQLKLHLPADTIADTYTSTITVAVASRMS
ncbi:MAG: WxL domain-containing protein [Ktedonobacteraceae bacterium]|nr:WxL domain-containing protein [Ktedonobacteraceae bacterium]